MEEQALLQRCNQVILSFNQPVVAATTGITVKVTKGTG